MKKIETKIGTMYYEIDFNENEIYLYDSDKNYINYFYIESLLEGNDDNCSIEELEDRIVNCYKDLHVVDESIRYLGEPVLWAYSKEDLLIFYNNYYEEQSERYGEEFESFTMEDFEENIQINRIGKIYFAIYFTEY